MSFLYLVPLALALLAVSSVEGQVPGFGSCPKAEVQQNFDISQYLGVWYEIEKFQAYFEPGKCIQANYTVKPDGHVRVENSGTVNGKPNVAVGDAYAPDPKEPAKLAVRFSNLVPHAPYWVLRTDYKTYTLIWSCVDLLGLSNAQFLWILARERELDPAVTSELRKVASGYNIDISHLKKSDQTGCDS